MPGVTTPEEVTMPRRPSTIATILALLALLATAFGGTTSPAAAQASGTLNFTFVSCPPGGDWSGPPPGCSDVVEAPEHATVTAPDWVQAVSALPRNADGSYTVTDVPTGDEEIGLVNFFSQNHNAFTFDGVDRITRWYGGVTLAPGETRNVTVFYWNGPVDLIMPAENTLVVNVSTCDEGVDPSVNPAGCEPYSGDVPTMYVGTSPLRGIQMEDYLSRDGGTMTYAGLPAYTQAQVVVHEPMTGYADVFVTGQAEEIGDDSATAFLLRGETRVIDVYFHQPDGSTRAGTWTLTEEEPEEGGTLQLLMLGCPAGVIPHDDPGACTEALEDDGTATVTFSGSGESAPLTDFERNENGAYVITGIEGSVTISGIVPGDGTRIASDADEINGDEIVYHVEPGETRDGRLYYFSEQ